jgi:hypothetical protein
MPGDDGIIPGPWLLIQNVRFDPCASELTKNFRRCVCDSDLRQSAVDVQRSSEHAGGLAQVSGGDADEEVL